LFLYGGVGRAACYFEIPTVFFFRGLLLACRIIVTTIFCYLVVGLEIWGNGTSLGGDCGVVRSDLLSSLWGALVVLTRILRLL